MTSIEFLLQKYETSHGENRKVNGEQTSNDYWNNQRRNATVKDRHLTLDKLLNETDQPLNPQQKIEVKTWIDLFKYDWKNIHRQSEDETIILALIIIQYKNNHYYIKKSLKNACLKYNLDIQKFMLIQNRIIFLLMKNTPLKYNTSEKYRQYIQTKEILQ